MTAHAPLKLRRTLLLGCALAGLCLATRIDQLRAQAFNGDPKTTAGVVAYDRATPGIETITVESNTAIITWTPNVGGNPIVFLPAGRTATFTNGPNNADFVVLNRILTNTPIRFDGHVVSILQNAVLGTSDIGGTVLFSSPGGIIIGQTAVFDVGNLVLTSLNVVDDGAGNFLDPASQGYQFGLAGVPPAAVITMPGSQINALNQGSYVAIVAPQIVHGGSIRVNGSAAFIAGQQVQMRVNQGLFDIVIDTGTDNVTPLIHTGSTGGPASTGAGDVHRIYLVAMPRNQAITAILQGNIGFDPAVNAAVENGAIVLSAGFGIAGGQVDRFGDFGPGPVPGVGASFEIRGGTVTSDLFGYAVTDMLASGGATGNLSFLQDVSLFAWRRAHLFAGTSQTVSVAGDALVSADRNRAPGGGVFDFTGGEALIFAQGGSLTIAGNATASASAQGVVDQVNSRAGNGTGGTAGIFADGGSVQIGGNVTVAATGQGGVVDFAPDQGGTGTGGKLVVEGRNGGSVQIGGTLLADASGTGSRANANSPVGAPGTGGAISVSATGGGTVTVAGPTTLTSTGTGGNVVDGPGNSGGTGTGGTISIMAGGTVTLNGATTITANGQGGLGPNGGNAVGGQIIVDATAGQVNFLGDTIVTADAAGGNGSFILGGNGGSGTGGNIAIRARSGTTASRIRGGAIALSARGTGGAGANGIVGTPAGDGGEGRGGTISLLAESGNGSVQFGAVTALADGTGGVGGDADFDGDGGRGGNGFGGDARVGTIAGVPGTPVAGGAQFASVNLSASGLGGAGGGGTGAGGNAVGGTSSLLAAGIPTAVAGSVKLTADATGGAGGGSVAAGNPPGMTGLADGGTIAIAATAAGTITAGDVAGTAVATGDPASTANSPGEWHVSAGTGSAINLANLTLTASASGTPGVRPFSSLEPLGGTITVAQLAQLSTQGEIRVVASGAGRILGGRYNLNAGDDITLSHTAPAAGGITIEVTDLFALAGDDFTAGAQVVTRTSNQTDIRARDLATVTGTILGREILIGSADIDLTGAVGDAGTQTATLLVGPFGKPPAGAFTVLGGTTQGPGYTLTNAEAGRIRADRLRILTPAIGGAPQDLLVRDLTFNGGGAATGIGTLEIDTPGIARVEGALLMTNASATGGISFTARERLEVVTPLGSVRVRDGTGAPGGVMLLSSNNLWVASAGIIDQLRLNPNYAGRDADLLDNGGVEEQRGYVEAGGVTLQTGGTLFVQNSGAPFSPAFGGITVGAGGLRIQTTGVAPSTVTAFGRRLNPDGTSVLATPFFFQVVFQSPGVPLASSYTLGSTFNTCVIVTGQCGGGIPGVQPQGPDPITGPVGGSEAIQLAGFGDEDDLVDTSFSVDPLIEEPVTSGGESSLWGCEDDDDDGICNAPNN